MRIVHCEDFFHPDTGYQLNILARYMQSKGHEVIILTSELEKMPAFLTDFFSLNNIQERDQAYMNKTGVRIIRLPIIAHLSGRSIYYPGYFKKLDSLQPDVAYIHGLDTYMGIRCAWRVRKFKYPILFDCHMAEGASENTLSPVFKWFYRVFVAPAINKDSITIIRTMNTDYVFKHYGINPELAPYIGFGSNLSLFHPDALARRTIRTELGISQSDFVVTYVGKLNESKGGLFLADAIKEKFHAAKDVTFLIVGNNTAVDVTYRQRVEEAFSISQNKIVRLPTQLYSEMNKFFQCADIVVFPKQCSLTFFDAQACALPALLDGSYDVNVQRVQHNNGMLFKSENIADLRKKIVMMANMPGEEMQTMRESAERFIVENYNYDNIASRYLEIIIKTIAK